MTFCRVLFFAPTDSNHLILQSGGLSGIAGLDGDATIRAAQRAARQRVRSGCSVELPIPKGWVLFFAPTDSNHSIRQSGDSLMLCLPRICKPGAFCCRESKLCILIIGCIRATISSINLNLEVRFNARKPYYEFDIKRR